MKERADCHMETQRRSRKHLLGEEEAVRGEKRQRLEEVVVSRSSDTRPSCDVPDCSSVSVFKLVKDHPIKIPILPYDDYSTHVISLLEWG